jgi:hypothetical protein
MYDEIKARTNRLIGDLVELYDQIADQESQDEMMLINLAIEEDKYNGY